MTDRELLKDVRTALKASTDQGKAELSLDQISRNLELIGELNVAIAEAVEYDIPDEGEVVLDTQGPSWGTGRFVVTEILGENAGDVMIEVNARRGKRKTSVAAYNHCDEHIPVVKGKYDDGSGKEYCLPVNRLESLDG